VAGHERELALVTRHDPPVPAESDSLEAAPAAVDAVGIATNHSQYDDVLARVPASALLVDPWNASGSGQVFAYADELAGSEGRLTRRVGDLLDVEPLPAVPGRRALSDVLDEQREERLD